MLCGSVIKHGIKTLVSSALETLSGLLEQVECWKSGSYKRNMQIPGFVAEPRSHGVRKWPTNKVYYKNSEVAGG
jgi:hypothetical protein